MTIRSHAIVKKETKAPKSLKFRQFYQRFSSDVLAVKRLSTEFTYLLLAGRDGYRPAAAAARADGGHSAATAGPAQRP